MTRSPTLVALLAGCTLLGACGSTGVLGRERPDEFAVQRQAPLVVPPDFNLVPPAPGAPRPATDSPAQQTLEALFGGPAQRSAVESGVIGRAGRAEPGIRSSVGAPATNVVDKAVLTRDLIAAPEGAGASAQAVIPG
ncbi:DUF3035 domain-containing protein [Erythrobacteraceae bacterium CFH 75059]|uniref:DUF3035 domain-containing protein n=1 Tax=Qipengyuania thermophila TaxID=2509361 RepID=UPI00101F7F19|nr:DUF3035 domain-containing protein [Qipengyuania thermophila]TCD06750.1 DUF3035 domain-containing protein [Erythrobacteraceae bacterium CFH 75059]